MKVSIYVSFSIIHELLRFADAALDAVQDLEPTARISQRPGNPPAICDWCMRSLDFPLSPANVKNTKAEVGNLASRKEQSRKFVVQFGLIRVNSAIELCKQDFQRFASSFHVEVRERAAARPLRFNNGQSFTRHP
jgi:hypothetical protein